MGLGIRLDMHKLYTYRNPFKDHMYVFSNRQWTYTVHKVVPQMVQSSKETIHVKYVQYQIMCTHVRMYI